MFTGVIEVAIAVEIDPGIEITGSRRQIRTRHHIDGNRIANGQSMSLQGHATDGDAIIIIPRISVRIIAVAQCICRSLGGDKVIVIHNSAKIGRVIIHLEHRHTMSRITITCRRIAKIRTGAAIATHRFSISRTAKCCRCLHIPVGEINGKYFAPQTTLVLIFQIQQAITSIRQAFPIHPQLGFGNKGQYTRGHINPIHINIIIATPRRSLVVRAIEGIRPEIVCQGRNGQTLYIDGITDLSPVIRGSQHVIRSIRVECANLVAGPTTGSLSHGNVQNILSIGVIVIGLESGTFDSAPSRLDDIVLDFGGCAGKGIDFIQITGALIVRQTLEGVELTVRGPVSGAFRIEARHAVTIDICDRTAEGNDGGPRHRRRAGIGYHEPDLTHALIIYPVTIGQSSRNISRMNAGQHGARNGNKPERKRHAQHPSAAYIFVPAAIFHL